MEHYAISQAEHGRIHEAQTLLQRAQEYTARRSKIEADVAAIISAGDYGITRKTVALYAEAAAALDLAQKIEPQLVGAMRSAYQRIRNLESNSESRVSSAHSQLDRTIAEYVASRLDADVAGAVVDFRQTPVFKSELAVRKLPPPSVEYFVLEHADLAKLIPALQRTIDNLAVIDAELQRVAKAEAEFGRKLKRAA